jgi:hypothetical protein
MAGVANAIYELNPNTTPSTTLPGTALPTATLPILLALGLGLVSVKDLMLFITLARIVPTALSLRLV